MFDNLKNLGAIMSQAGHIREKAEQFQKEMEAKRIEAESGAGAVQIVVNGKCEVISLKLDPTMLRTLVGSEEGPEQADLEMVEELIKAAFNTAQKKVHDAAREELASATGGLNIPGLENLLG